MFKVGDFVRIKSYSNIVKEDKKLHMAPIGPSHKKYCCKYGRVIKIRSSIMTPNCQSVWLDISSDLDWYSPELVLISDIGFISLKYYV